MNCKNCTKRVLHCHSACTDYIAFKNEQETKKKKQKLETEVHSYIVSTARYNRDKRIKRQNLPNKNYQQ